MAAARAEENNERDGFPAKLVRLYNFCLRNVLMEVAVF